MMSAFVLLCLQACSTTSYVSEQDGSYGRRVSCKMARGVVNVATSPLEIPIQSIRMAEKGDSAVKEACGYVGGLFVGTGYFVWRLGAGLGDIITAPATWWDRALIAPEFIDLDVKAEAHADSEVDTEK